MKRGLLLAAVVAACGNSSSNVDAPGGTADVTVVPGCTGVAAGAIGATISTTSSDTFSPSTASITAGQYVKFTTTGDHNFQNQPGAAVTFSSGSPGAQTTCLQFNAAGSYPFECEVHASMGMTGTLTVD